jgi:TonB family protein
VTVRGAWLATSVGAVAVAAACATVPQPPTANARDPLPARCDSLPPAADTGSLDLLLGLRVLRDDPLPKAYTSQVLDVLVRGFVAPNPLVMPAFIIFSDTGKVTAWKMTQVTAGEVTFTLDSVGTPRDVRLSQSTLSPEIDQALIAMVRADSTHPFPTIKGGVAGSNRVQFIANLGSEDTSGTAAMLRRGRALNTGESTIDTMWAHVLRVRVPHWNEVLSAAPLANGTIKPIYPDSPLRAGVGDRVMLQFVIDEAGHPLPSTIRVVSAGDDQFASATVEAVTRSHYRPASIRGCAVKALVQQPFTFFGAKRSDSLESMDPPPRTVRPPGR